MFEAIVISFVVGFAALHVASKLLPKLVQQKLRSAMAAGLNKIGFHSMALRAAAAMRAAGKDCSIGCDGCGAEAAGDEAKVDGGAKVIQFHPRLR